MEGQDGTGLVSGRPWEQAHRTGLVSSARGNILTVFFFFSLFLFCRRKQYRASFYGGPPAATPNNDSPVSSMRKAKAAAKAASDFRKQVNIGDAKVAENDMLQNPIE